MMKFPSSFRVVSVAVLFVLFQFEVARGQDLYFLPASRQVTHFCGQVCNFRLCEDDGEKTPLLPGVRVPVRPAGNVSTPWICLPGSKLGAIRETGEARVRPVREIINNIPISTYERKGLSPPFSPSFFSLAEVNYGPSFPGKYGIVREKSLGNQDDFLDDLCVQIPIRKFDISNREGSGYTTVTTTKREDCVGFTAQLTQIHIELTWDTNDDLDLSLIEPNGDVVAYNSRISRTGGRLLRDINSRNCFRPSSGKEVIIYDMYDRPLNGIYEVQVRHYSSCPQNERTKWYLSIFAQGKLVFKTRNATYPGAKDRFIRRRRFRFPLRASE